jgi:hypothetical protein
MAADKGDIEGARAFYDKVMETEGDPAVRGQLLFAKFAYFWGTDSLESVEIAREALGSDERDFRTLMYMAYYLMGAEGQEGIADSIFRHLIDVTRDELKKNHARTVYGEFLEKDNRGEEALEVLGKASAYTFANEPLGRIMWEKGEREKALDSYIRLAAGAPGYRKYIGLDSLYATVHPEPNDLDKRIAAARIFDGRLLPDREFVDIHGARHSIEGYRGGKMVILAFSPT